MKVFQLFQYFMAVTNHKAQCFPVLDIFSDNETDSYVVNTVLIADF